MDEELLGRIMRGEETLEVNLDGVAVIEPMERDATPANEQPETGGNQRKNYRPGICCVVIFKRVSDSRIFQREVVWAAYY